jgi:hypothetical protein
MQTSWKRFKQNLSLKSILHVIQVCLYSWPVLDIILSQILVACVVDHWLNQPIIVIVFFFIDFSVNFPPEFHFPDK